MRTFCALGSGIGALQPPLTLLLLWLAGGPLFAIMLDAPRAAADTPWWDDQWSDRLDVRITALDPPLHDVQVPIDLRSTLSVLDGGGQDLRFVWYDATSGEQHLLSHWLTTARITHGAWFACCSSNGYTQYHTPAATYYTNNRPTAIRFTGVHDRTYFVYGDFSRDPVARYYDHDEERLSSAAVPGLTLIADDAHGNPSLLVDQTGHLHLFFGCHGGAIQVRHGLVPESIEEWSAETRISVLASYPQPYELDSSRWIVSFRRDHQATTRPWSYVLSSNGGTTWSPSADIVFSSGDALYALSEVGDEEPTGSYHLALNPFNYASRLYGGIYYMVSTDGLETFQAAGGAALGEPPLNLTAASLVYDSGALSSHLCDFALDSDGRPLLLFNVGPWDQDGDPGPGDWMFARHTPSGWTISTIADCDHLFDRGCLVIEEDGTLRAYLPHGQDEQDGGEMWEFTSFDDGETWSLSEEITASSEFSHNFAVRVRAPHPEFQVLWSYGSSEPTGSSYHEQASEVILHGHEGTIGTIEYGARAWVRLPELEGVETIQLYYGNPDASDVSQFETAMQVSQVALPSGLTDPDLLLEWLTEEGSGSTLADESSQGNDGAGQFTGNEWLPGGSTFERRYDVEYPGSVIELVTSDHVTVPALAGPSLLTQATAEIWCWPDRSTTTNDPLILVGDPAIENISLQIRSGRIRFVTRTSALAGGTFYTPHLAADKWHHIAAVYNGSQLSVYLDGQKSPTTFTQTGGISWADQPMLLGKSGTFAFRGRIDEVRLYGRALAQNEVLAHYEKRRDAETLVELLPGSVSVPEATVQLISASPNPFADAIRFRLRTGSEGAIEASIFDASGRRVRELPRVRATFGREQEIVWDGRDDAGRLLPGGVYFGALTTGSERNRVRLVIIR